MSEAPVISDYHIQHNVFNFSKPSTKHEIVVIGTFDFNGMPIGWEFDGRHSLAAGVDVVGDPILFGGHTLDELREIVSLKNVD